MRKTLSARFSRLRPLELGDLLDRTVRLYRRNFLRMLSVSAVVALFGPWPGPALAGESIPLDEYWRRVEETRALLDDLEGLPPAEQRAGLWTAADEWASLKGVVLPDGARLALEHSELAAGLRADPPDAPYWKGRLEALLEARDRWTPPSRTTGDLASLARILARPEFDWPTRESSALEDAWQRFWEAVWRFLLRLLLRGGGLGLEGSWAGYALSALAVLLLGAVLAYALRGLSRGFVGEAEIPAEADSGDAELTAESALRQAQARAEAGDYRLAVRYLYLSSLLLLEERGALRYDRSLTNREYLRHLAHRPELASILRDVVEVFERAWYGYRPVDPAAFARYAARVTELAGQI